MGKLHQLIGSPTFSPAMLRQAGDAFERAWGQIEAEFRRNEDAASTARQRLATIVLGFSAAGQRDAERLTRSAVAAMSHH
jgi:hypothetical protein